MLDRQERERGFLFYVSLLVKVIVILAIAAMLALGLADIPFVTNRMASLEPEAPLVGIIAGHWQYDSGAICPDGTQEVDLNLDIARQVVVILRERGYRVEMYPEYSPELNGLVADALFSIHCDSCINMSGFKVARRTDSATPYLDDQLVEAVYASYERATGLKPHYNTITEHMLEYHALRRIAPNTPGAIIECGFMGGDRRILTEESARVAAGIADGLLTFLEAQGKGMSTPTPGASQ